MRLISVDPGLSEHGRGETLFRDTFRDTHEASAKKNLYFTGFIGRCLIPVSASVKHLVAVHDCCETPSPKPAYRGLCCFCLARSVSVPKT